MLVFKVSVYLKHIWQENCTSCLWILGLFQSRSEN